MNNVCRALAKTSVSTANALHPSVLAARLSFTLCSRRTPSKRITKAEITFGNTIVQPLPCNTRPNQRIHTQTCRWGLSLQHHGQLSALLVTAIIVSMGPLAPSSPVIETFWQHTSQLTNMLLPLATSDLAVRGWSVTLLLWASIVHFFSSSHLLLLQFF